MKSRNIFSRAFVKLAHHFLATLTGPLENPLRRFSIGWWLASIRSEFERIDVRIPDPTKKRCFSTWASSLYNLSCPASYQANKRLTGRFLFLHTQKHTQEYLLDFKSSAVNRLATLPNFSSGGRNRTYYLVVMSHRCNQYTSPQWLTSCRSSLLLS